MERILYFLTGLPFLFIGIFVSFFSKRLAVVLIKSTKIMEETFNIKREWGRGAEIFTQVTLIIFGLVFMVSGIRVIIETFSKNPQSVIK